MVTISKDELEPADKWKKLGDGGFGAVFRVFWKTQNKHVAVKKLFKTDNFQEVEILKKLKHPNIVTFFGFVHEENTDLLILLELCELGSLKSFLEQHNDTPLPPGQRFDWMLEAALPIEYLRRFDIEHMDIKTDNYVINSNMVLKLTDFGLSQVLEGTKSYSSEAGSWRWMPPERFAPKPKLSPKFHIYALALVFWCLFTRSKPYAEYISEFAVADAVQKGVRPVIPSCCPTPIADLIEVCWHDDRSLRPDITTVILTLLQHKSSFAATSQAVSTQTTQRGVKTVPTQTQVQKFLNVSTQTKVLKQVDVTSQCDKCSTATESSPVTLVTHATGSQNTSNRKTMSANETNSSARSRPNARHGGRSSTPRDYSPATPRRPESHKSFSPKQDREPPALEVSGFDTSMDEEVLLMYFESPRKSGGGDLEEFQMSPSGQVATIKFADVNVTARVLKKSHKVLGQALTVVEKKEDESPDEDHTDSPGSVLEVSGFKSSTSEDMLMMYFENTRRSGGDEIEAMEMNPKDNKATITFVDQGAIARVVNKSHKLDGAKLDVREKKAKPPRPIDKHRIFLQEIPEDVTREILVLFIENRTGIDDPGIVYGEQPGTAMLFFDEEIEDIDSIIAKFGKRKLKRSVVSAEKVKVTDGVLVQGYKANTSRDMIELYFENQRKSGGGAVNDITFNEDENIAFVSFEDWQIVNKVTSRTHTLSGQRLTVTAHYECMGTVVSTEGPVPVVPKPIQHQVHPQLMKHVKDRQMKGLVSEMKQVHAEVVWPCNGDRSQALIKPLDGGNEDRSVWKQWKSNATSNFASFLETICEENIQVPSNVWKDVTDALVELTLGNVDVEEKANKSTITIRGMMSDVSKAKTLILQSVSELKEKAERAAQTVEKTVKLAPLKIKMLKMFGIENELHGKYPEVQTSIQSDRYEIVFTGVRGEVSETVVAMYQVFEALGSCAFKEDPPVVEFVSRFCDEVNGVIASQNVEAIFDVDYGKVSVYGKSRSARDKALSILQKDVISKSMSIRSDSTMNVLQSKKGTDTINKLNDSGEVIIRLESSNRRILITGLTQKVDDAIVKIGTFLDENVVIQKMIPLPPSHVNFIIQRCGTEVAEMQRKFPDVTMSLEVQGKQSGFLVKGNEKGITGVCHLFESLKSKLVDRKHTIDKAGMPDLLRAKRGKTFLQSIATECDCHISSADDLDTDGRSTSGPVDTPGSVSTTLCHVTTTAGYRLMVCHGDLTKERVDAIVNAANPRLAHVGGLAKAIADAGGPAIQQESNATVKKLGRHLNRSEAVCTGAGQLPCRHVIHVSGPTWSKALRDDPAHSLEKDLLYDAVTNSLRQAHAKNLTSIAIPAISTGVYGFPIKPCAETVLEATVDFMTGSGTSLREIRFTNIVREHCTAFQNVLKEKFKEDVIDGSATVKRSVISHTVPKPKPRSEAGAGPATPAQSLTLFTKKSSDILTTKEGKGVTLKKESAFEVEMQQRKAAAEAEAEAGKGRSEDEKDTLVLFIVARDVKKLDQAVRRIENYIQNEYFSEEFAPPFGKEDTTFTGEMMGEIKGIGHKHKVLISLTSDKKKVVLEGARAAVLETKAYILSQLARMQAEEKRRAKEGRNAVK